MKKILTVILICFVMLVGCSSSAGTEVLNSKNPDARVVNIGIHYQIGLITGASKKTEATVYIDDIEVDKINRGDRRAYVTCLDTGTHSVKVKRKKNDVCEYKFDVEPVEETDIFQEKYIGLTYSYISGFGKTKLEKTEYPDVTDDDYIWFYDGERKTEKIKPSTDDDNDNDNNDVSEKRELLEMIGDDVESAEDLIKILESNGMIFEVDSADSINVYLDDENGLQVEDITEEGIFIINSSNPALSINGIYRGMGSEEAVDLIVQGGGDALTEGEHNSNNVYFYHINDKIIGIEVYNDTVESVVAVLGNVDSLIPSENSDNENSDGYDPVNKAKEYEEFAEYGPVNYNGHAYAIFNFREDLHLDTFDECEDYCEKMGGHLAVIDSEDENEFLFSYLKDCDMESAFFGYTDEDVTGDWKWVDGSDSRYTNWGSGQPNNRNGEEHYAQFYGDMGDGIWNDAKFGSQSWRFICEWE